MDRQPTNRKRNTVARQGDIYTVSLDLTKGHEQNGMRPVVVVSQTKLNRIMDNVSIILPITTKGGFIQKTNFGVELPPSLKTEGIVIACQPRTIDLKAGNAVYKEAVPSETLDDILAKFIPCIV